MEANLVKETILLKSNSLKKCCPTDWYGVFQVVFASVLGEGFQIATGQIELAGRMGLLEHLLHREAIVEAVIL